MIPFYKLQRRIFQLCMKVFEQHSSMFRIFFQGLNEWLQEGEKGNDGVLRDSCVDWGGGGEGVMYRFVHLLDDSKFEGADLGADWCVLK